MLLTGLRSLSSSSPWSLVAWMLASSSVESSISSSSSLVLAAVSSKSNGIEREEGSVAISGMGGFLIVRRLIVGHLLVESGTGFMSSLVVTSLVSPVGWLVILVVWQEWIQVPSASFTFIAMSL